MSDKNQENHKSNILTRYQQIRDQVEEIAKKAGRLPGDIHIIAVSKTFPLEITQEAISSGITEIGENRIQEACTKIPQLKGKFINHFIGHLQKNKIKSIISHSALFHSLDKEETAKALEKELEKLKEKRDHSPIYTGYLEIPPGKAGIFLQVNTTGEESKFGISPDNALKLAEKLKALNNLKPLGLMTMGPTHGRSRENRQAFSQLYQIQQQILRNISPEYKYLSMGMSGDFEDAILEGATHVRIGSAIFGPRPYPK